MNYIIAFIIAFIIVIYVFYNLIALYNKYKTIKFKIAIVESKLDQLTLYYKSNMNTYNNVANKLGIIEGKINEISSELYDLNIK